METIKPLGEHELLLLLVQFGLLLLVARAMGQLAVRVGLPSVVGELLAGFVLGPTLLGTIAPGVFEAIFPQEPGQVHLLEVISWIGVLMLLVLTGLETDVGLIARKGKGAAAISLGGIAVPFATGITLGFMLPKEFNAKPDQQLVFALFIGTAMSISAIPVIAKVLMEMNVIRRDIGQVTLAAGMIDDTVGWILLSVVAGMARSGSVKIGSAVTAVVSVVGVLAFSFLLGKRLVTRVIRAVDNRVGGDMVKITALMVMVLAFASLTQALHLEAVLGAFIVGVLVGQVKRFDAAPRHAFEQVALGVFAPVFFAASGLRVDLSELFEVKVLAVGLIVLAVAIGGKFIGAYVGARATKLGHWEGLALGAGMNARGAMEIIVATIGLSLGILTPKMYTIILLTAIVTSLMAPPLLRWTLGRVHMTDEEKERLEAEERRKKSFVSNLKRVLIPTTGEPGVQAAAQIVGLLVRDEDVEVTSLFLQPSDDGDESSPKEAAEGPITEIESQLDLPDAHNQRRVVRAANGDAGSVVLGEAEKGYDLLVIPASGRRDPGERTLFNEPVDAVIQEAPCPVLVVSTGGDAGSASEPLDLRHILLPVFGTAADRSGAEVAFAIARNRDIVVDVLHVVSEPNHRSRSGGGEGLESARELGEDLVGRIADMGHSVGATVHTEVIVADHVEEAVIARAEGRADLIVVESNRSPVSQRAFFGHHVDYVLRNAPFPVVVVGLS